MYARRTRSFSRSKMRSNNSARMNKSNILLRKSFSLHMAVIEIVVHRNVDIWIQLLT